MSRVAACLLVVFAALLAVPAEASARGQAKREMAERIERLPPKYRVWLEEVELLLSDEEREAFLALEKDYQRDAFIDRFWRARDPYPNTARNELQDRWQARVEYAKSNWGSLTDDRSRILLLNGEPDAMVQLRCTIVQPIEVWYWKRSERLREELFLVFYERFGGRREYQLWRWSDGLGALLRDAGFGFDPDPATVLRTIRDSCLRDGDALVAALSFALRHGVMGYPVLLMRAEEPLEAPAGEWLATFASYSTDLPEQAATFPVDLSFAFPGRHQSRTVVQGTLEVPVAEIGAAELAGARSRNLLLTGEVLQGEQLFDRFRYKFDVPEGQIAGEILPLAFERFLRPGDYRVVLKLEDLNGHRYFRTDEQISVPALAQEPPPPVDAESAALLAEANAALSATERTVELLEPTGGMQVGKVRFDALVTGEGVEQVVFSLDGQPVLQKRAPPWSVELDLGNLPRSQLLGATAYDAAGEELAHDELLLNASAHRFAARLLAPRPGERFRESLRAEVEVEVPEGQRVERVELYLDETLAATLYQPPYVQPLRLPEPDALAYVRSVAYLPDGNSTEDTVFVNAPPGLEEIDVQLVELFASVTGRDGRPVEGLAADDFTVREDGVVQEIRRFEKVDDLPFHAVVLLDVSASMEDRLEQTQHAALSFFEQAIQPRDRAALVTFNDRPVLAQKFTNRMLDLGGALAGLKAERGTALWDSVVFSLYYFNGVKGQRALLLLSDGQDESSRFSYEETLEFARRAGVTIFSIGLDLGRGFDVKKKLGKLAEETGGRAVFVDSPEELPAVYRAIEQELRSQYLIAYQSTNSAPDGEFRTVELDVAGAGLEADTIRGYYP